MSWSFDGRHTPGCSTSHSSEANCLRHALAWRDALLDRLDARAREYEQTHLFPPLGSPRRQRAS